MLPQFLGMLMLIATVVLVVVALGIALWARVGNRGPLARRALIGGAAAAVIYSGFWILGLVLASREVVPPGSQLTFCGFDCHLHVSVQQVRSGPDVGVTVHFASNARQAPEWPAALRFRLRDAAGREYAPSKGVPETSLAAGASRDYELIFPGASTAAGSVLIVTWAGALDYLVPGAGNPLVQRQRRLALPSATGA